MTDLLLEIAALAVYGPAIVLLHELGHAVLARTGGYRVTSFAIGLGPPVLRLTLAHGIVLWVGRWLLAGGACVAVPLGPATPRRGWFHSGGLLAQLLLGLVLFLLPDSWLLARMAQFNLLVAVTNAIPWKFGGSASDGWYLLDLLAGRRRSSEMLPQRLQLERLATRERAIGSPVGTIYADLCLAWVNVLAGRTEEAAELFEREPPEAVVEPWIDALYHYVSAELQRQLGDPDGALQTARQPRRAWTDELGEASAALLSLAEARSLIELDRIPEAQDVLRGLTGLGGPIGRQATAVALHAALTAQVSDLEQAAWRVGRRIQESWLDPVDTACALDRAALRLREEGFVEVATGVRQAASALATRILESADPSDRDTLRRRLAPEA